MWWALTLNASTDMSSNEVVERGKNKLMSVWKGTRRFSAACPRRAATVSTKHTALIRRRFAKVPVWWLQPDTETRQVLNRKHAFTVSGVGVPTLTSTAAFGRLNPFD